MSDPLHGAVVVVTGATGAAGPATVEALAKAGATVVVAGRDQARLDHLADNAGRIGDNAARELDNDGRELDNDGRVGERPSASRIETTVVDLLDEDATRTWGAGLVETYGRVDGLIHLVGGWRGGQGIVEADLADYAWLHDNLVRTLQHTTRALHDAIVASPVGRVAIVSTTMLERPTAKNAAYLTSKAAAETWMRALGHSFEAADADAASVILRIKALLTPQMRADKPEAKFAGFTPVDLIAEEVVSLFDQPVQEINREILDVLPAPS
ncbi:SDR family NAD(P)-dependent oxidoreductase [Demetria terragena]|uniref:SDR family NAD(P)-dependent oxidoreductase n=1 Tax=Demetria terragena TaxID=63959 RepID=UPI00037201EF|nr:SDR family oxidoreductase [Demetria terragena]